MEGKEGGDREVEKREGWDTGRRMRSGRNGRKSIRAEREREEVRGKKGIRGRRR